MKPKEKIFLVLTLPLAFVNWVDINTPVIRITAISRIYAATPTPILTKDEILLAKIVCPPRGPCYDDGRSSVSAISIISPSRGVLLASNNTPMLSWSAVPGATSYSVRVEHSGKTLWDKPVENRTEIPYPKDKPPLEPDKDYDLIVETIVGNDRKLGRLRFRLLSQPETQRVQAEAQTISTNTKLTADEKALKLAELYQKNDLLTEAIESLKSAVKNQSRSVPIYQRLGDLYIQVGLPTLAEFPYQQALNLATTLNDTNAQAEAQVGLAKVNVANMNWEQAINLLEAAHASYETLKNRELTTQVAQFLGEVYNKSGNRDKAIYWYQQAKTGYEALGDTERLNYVERQLRNLKQ